MMSLDFFCDHSDGIRRKQHESMDLFCSDSALWWFNGVRERISLRTLGPLVLTERRLNTTVLLLTMFIPLYDRITHLMMAAS